MCIAPETHLVAARTPPSRSGNPFCCGSLQALGRRPWHVSIEQRRTQVLGTVVSKGTYAQVLVSETRASFDAAKQELEVVMPAAPLPPAERVGAGTASSARCATLQCASQQVQAGADELQAHHSAPEGEPEGSSTADVAGEPAARQAASDRLLRERTRARAASTGGAAQGSAAAQRAQPHVSAAVPGGPAELHSSAMGGGTNSNEQLTLADMQAVQQGVAAAWQGPAAHTVITELDAGTADCLMAAKRKGVLEQPAPAEQGDLAREAPARQGGAESVRDAGCAAAPTEQAGLPLAVGGDGLTENERLWRRVHSAWDADESARAAGAELAPAVARNGGQESHAQPLMAGQRGSGHCKHQQPRVQRMQALSAHQEAASAHAAGLPRGTCDPALPASRAQPRRPDCPEQGPSRHPSIRLKPRVSNAHADDLM